MSTMMHLCHLDTLHNNEKGKWLFMNICKCKSPICTGTECLKCCQVGANECVYLRVVLESNDTSVEEVSYI